MCTTVHVYYYTTILLYYYTTVHVYYWYLLYMYSSSEASFTRAYVSANIATSRLTRTIEPMSTYVHMSHPLIELVIAWYCSRSNTPN